jgi:hypothetical protein
LVAQRRGPLRAVDKLLLITSIACFGAGIVLLVVYLWR